MRVDCDDVERGKDKTHHTTACHVDLGHRCSGAVLELLGVTGDGSERQAPRESIRRLGLPAAQTPWTRRI